MEGKICKKCDFIVCGVYWHGIEFTGELADVEEYVRQRRYSEITRRYYLMARRDSTIAAIDCKRNLMEHLDNHLEEEQQQKRKKDKGKGQKKSSDNEIDDFDDVEIYASASLDATEHNVLKCVMKHRQALTK